MKDKKKALTIAVAAALVISNPLSMTGCTRSPYTNNTANDEEDDNDVNIYNGGGHYNSGRSYIKSGSSKSGISDSTWSTPSKGSTSGYSGSHGGGTSG